MATISERTKKNGARVFTAQIRLNVDGIKHSETKTDTDKKHLEKWAAAREEQLRRPGALAALKAQGVTVGSVIEWYMADFQGAREFGRTKLGHLKQMLKDDDFASLDATKITPAQLIAHARARSKTAQPQTILNDFVWLSNSMKAVRLSRDLPLNIQAVADAMELLRKEGLIAKANKRDRRPTIDELNRLMEYCGKQDGRAHVPLGEIILFALFSARRQDEITRLTWADLDMRRKGVLVRAMKHPRMNLDTFVFLTPEAMEIILRQPKIDERIFPYKGKTVSGTFTRICKVIGIKDLHFHDLRHECCSWLFELGWEIPKVSGVSGHRSWSSLQRYTHIQHHEPHDKYAGWQFRPQLSS